MLCTHQSIKRTVTGQVDHCISCKRLIIWNGTWLTFLDVDPPKRQKLLNAFNVDQLTGAHE